MKTFLMLAVAATGLTAAVPASAQRHVRTRCVEWRHGRCTLVQVWNNGRWARQERRMERAERRAERRAQWNVGYRFGPTYGYTPYASIPRNYVTQYNLNPDYRYVYRNNYIYQVNPRTYAIERVLDALTR